MIAYTLLEHYMHESPWREKTWETHRLNEIYETYAENSQLALISFDGSSAKIKAGKIEQEDCFPSLLFFFQSIQQLFPITGSILLSLLDGAPQELSAEVPMLTFSKFSSDKHSLLIPDTYYLSNYGYHSNFETYDRILNQITSADRMPTVYWRGSSTGLPTLSTEKWKENPRVRLCFFSKAHANFIDAKLTRLVQVEDQSLKSHPELLSIFSQWEPLTNNFLYRFGIDIDGNSCSWGLFQKLYMNVSLLKVTSDWMQWYYPLLEEGKHFLSIDTQFSDLPAQVTRLRNNLDYADELAAHARALATSLNFGQAVLYVGLLLKELFHENNSLPE